MNERRSDEALVKAVLKGDDQALRQLHDRYIDQVFQYAYTQMNDYHRAEEVTQDIMYKMAVHLADFKGKSSFKTWLFSISRRVVIDYYRKYGKEKERLQVDSERLRGVAAPHSVEGKVLQNSFMEQVLQGLNQLSVDDRTVIHLRFFEGLSLAETAKVMSRTTQAVKSLQHRAKRKLAERLKWEGDDLNGGR